MSAPQLELLFFGLQAFNGDAFVFRSMAVCWPQRTGRCLSAALRGVACLASRRDSGSRFSGKARLAALVQARKFIVRRSLRVRFAGRHRSEASSWQRRLLTTWFDCSLCLVFCDHAKDASSSSSRSRTPSRRLKAGSSLAASFQYDMLGMIAGHSPPPGCRVFFMS